MCCICFAALAVHCQAPRKHCGMEEPIIHLADPPVFLRKQGPKQPVNRAALMLQNLKKPIWLQYGTFQIGEILHHKVPVSSSCLHLQQEALSRATHFETFSALPGEAKFCEFYFEMSVAMQYNDHGISVISITKAPSVGLCLPFLDKRAAVRVGKNAFSTARKDGKTAVEDTEIVCMPTRGI